MIRTPIALVPYLAMVVAMASGLLWHQADQMARLGGNVVTGTAEIGGPFTLTDQDGKTRSDADFRGRYMLVYFGYSFCPDVCPTTLAMMGKALDELGSRKGRVVPIFITVDPGRDTPQILKAYLKSFGENFVGLTGDIAGVAHAYHVFYARQPMPGGNYAMNHSGVIYLMGPDGRFVTYYEDEIGPDKMAEELRGRI